MKIHVIRFVLVVVLALGFVSLTPSVKVHAEGVCSLTVRLTDNRADFSGKSANETNIWRAFSFGDNDHTNVYIGADGSFTTWHYYDPHSNYTASFENGCSVNVTFVLDSDAPSPGVQIGSCTLPSKIQKLLHGEVRANGNANIDIGKGELFGMTRNWLGVIVDITADGKVVGRIKVEDRAGSNHWDCSVA